MKVIYSTEKFVPAEPLRVIGYEKIWVGVLEDPLSEMPDYQRAMMQNKFGVATETLYQVSVMSDFADEHRRDLPTSEFYKYADTAIARAKEWACNLSEQLSEKS